jgi:preprotein translocase SecE subunit
VARDRQRAKQRRARRAAQQGGAQQEPAKGAAPDGAPQQPPPDDYQGPLGHIGESDVVEAAIVAGAGGEQATEGATDAVGGAEHPEDLSDAEFATLEDRVDAAEQAIEDGEQPELTDQELERLAKTSAPAGAAAPPGAPTKRGPARFAAFLRASWAELQRVQWPDRRQVGQATAVVLGFVVVAGLYLGLADALAQEIVDFLI